MKSKTKFYFENVRPHIGEVNELASETVPGQTYPIRELLARAMRGLAVPQFEPEYDEPFANELEAEVDPTNTLGLDLVTAHEYHSHLKSKLGRAAGEPLESIPDGGAVEPHTKESKPVVIPE